MPRTTGSASWGSSPGSRYVGRVATKVREIAQGASLPACSSIQPCSVNRRPDRVYEDQVWALALALGPGHHVHDPACR